MKRTPFRKLTLEEVKAKQLKRNPKLIGYGTGSWGEKSLADKINADLDKLYAPRKPKKVPKKKVKKLSISKLKKDLWNEIKRIVRARFNIDGEYYCFTCGNLTAIPHTGHIIASSLCSTEMRYSLDNLRLQCYMCNIHKSGNWVGFYEVLGKDYIEDLIKRNNESKFKSYHTDWYLGKIEEYKKL